MTTKPLLQDETLSKKLITKGFWSYLFAFIVAPAGYLLRMFLSDSVSVAEVGVFYSVLGLMVLLSSYNDLWLTESMMYFIPKYRIKNEKAKARLIIIASFVMQMLTGILIFCLVYFGADWLAIHHFHDPVASQILKILAFYFFGLNIITLCGTLFVSFQDSFSQWLTSAIQQVVNLIFTITFWSLSMLTVISYAWIRIIGVVTTIIVGWSIVLVKYRHIFCPSKDETFLPNEVSEVKSTIKTHFKYAIWVFLVANVSNLLWSVDLQVVSNVLWSESAGFFTNFQALLMVFVLIVTPMFGLLFPITTELATKKDDKKFWLLQNVMYTYFGAFAMMIAGFFIVFGQEIAVFLFWESFRFSGYLLQWASPALIFSCWASISINILAWLGKIKQRLGVVALALGINIILNLIFLVFLKQGLVFSAVILSFSWAVMALWAMRVIHHEYKFSLDWRFLLKNLLFIGVLCLIMYMTKWSEDSRMKLFFLLLVYFVWYGVILAGLNRWKIKLLIGEIKKLRQ